MSIAVIGGGWAGLTAAWSLLRQGQSVELFEAARVLGGRARTVHARKLDLPIDNGQHILLGAYTETLTVMQELGLDPDLLFHRESMALDSADGAFRLHALPLPAPLHLLGGVLSARGLSLKERLGLIRLISTLRRQDWTPAAGLSVLQWLQQGRQTPHAIRMFWQPLCLAALNTPIDQACALLFAHVLRDSLGGSKTDTDILISRVDLSSLWPNTLASRFDELASQGARLHLAHAVRQLDTCPTGVYVDGQHFDAVVVAGNTPSCLKLLQQLPAMDGSQAYLAMLSNFRFLPIATLTLQLEQAWHLPHPMLMLQDSPEQLQFGQWLFDRSAYAAKNLTMPNQSDNTALNAQRLLHVVISDASALQAHAPSDIAQAIIKQIQTQTRRFGNMPHVVNYELIVEKRATFAATPALPRPGVNTPWPRVWVAGDWTDTGYPGVLEGAVRSGRAAAQAISSRLAKA